MINKENRLLVFMYFVFTFVLFLSIIGAKVSFKYTSTAKSEQTRSSSTVDIDWEELYPYDMVVDTKESDVVRKEVSIIDKLAAKIKKFSTLGNNWAKTLPFYSEISKVGYVINSFLTDPSVGNSYIKTRDGYWVFADLSKILLDDAKETVVPYASLQEYVESKGIDFLYFYAPSKICAVDSGLPEGAICYTNDNIDTYLNAMDYYGIQYVDLRKNIHDKGINHYSMFYKSDHHWTVESGLWAASEMTKEINERFGYSLIDPYDLGNYDLVTYPKAEFGSTGQGVTHFLADSEDFIIPYPEFNTNYRLEIPNKEIDSSGSFYDIFVDHDGLKDVIEQGGGAAYGKILYGNPPYEKITNLNNPDGPRILMIRDSFSIVMAPYFASSCSELLMLDTRPGNGYFTGSIINCINDFDPDIVLAFQYSPQAIQINSKE